MGTWNYFTATKIVQKTPNFGGGKRDRTADLLHAMQALSQLSYTPEKSKIIACFGAVCKSLWPARWTACHVCASVEMAINAPLQSGIDRFENALTSEQFKHCVE